MEKTNIEKLREEIRAEIRDEVQRDTEQRLRDDEALKLDSLLEIRKNFLRRVLDDDAWNTMQEMKYILQEMEFIDQIIFQFDAVKEQFAFERKQLEELIYHLEHGENDLPFPD